MARGGGGLGGRRRGVLGRWGLTGWAQAGGLVGLAAIELQALGLEAAADLGGVAEGGAADRAVGLQDAVGALEALADEALVQRAGVDVRPAGGGRDVAVAHPGAGWDGGDGLTHQVEVHERAPSVQGSSEPDLIMRGPGI